MFSLRRFNASSINAAFAATPLWIMVGLALLAAPVVTFAQTPPAPNADCTLLVPNAPRTAAGLATPYQLVATDPANGPCHQTDFNQSAFVQAGILDPATGQVSIYSPLVIDKGSSPATPPVVPTLPANAVVALWFGFNADNLTLRATDGVLEENHCVQGFAQFAYCNAPAFFRAAHKAIRAGQLHVPPLGVGLDGRPCPTVRSFVVADQDQSDNLPTTYLVTPSGLLAQDTAQNKASFPGSKVLGNPSDNRLMNVFMNPALGCASWEAPDLANPGHQVASMALNELSARTHQGHPRALIPAGDPFVLNPTFTGRPELGKVNGYRRGVDQPEADDLHDASTRTYCRHIRKIGGGSLILDRPFFTAFRSPFPNVANNLFTFMAQRFVATYEILNCQAVLHKPNPVTLITDANGLVIDATVAAVGSDHQDRGEEHQGEDRRGEE